MDESDLLLLLLQREKTAEKVGRCFQTLEHNAFRILEETDVLKCGRRGREGVAKTA